MINAVNKYAAAVVLLPEQIRKIRKDQQKLS